MKSNILNVLAGFAFASILAACGDSDSSSASGENEQPRDSVVIRDSLNWIDTIRIIDSLRIKDSLRIRDSVHIVDSISYKIVERVEVVDSVNIIDSINYIDSTRIVDSINVIDSLYISFKDSTRLVDSVITHTPEEYLGKCNANNAGQLKIAEVNGEDRYFYCDMGTYLWRNATKQEKDSDINDRYVRDSRVTDFVPLEDVFRILQSDEKLIVMLRHAERDDDITVMSALTETGRLQSQELGRRLLGSPDMYYAGSQYYRTHMTYNNIAIGHGDLDTLGDTMAVLNEGWYIKNYDIYYMSLFRENDDGRGVITKWAAQGGYTDAFYDLAPRSSELIEEFLIPALRKSQMQVGMFISHDVMLIPLVSYVSEGRITMKYYQKPVEGDNWLNYLAGIAVILKPDGCKKFFAVKGLESGTMRLSDDE